MQQITPCLWFDHHADEAMAFYTAIFDRSRIVQIERYPDAALDEHFTGMTGKVISGTFELAGQQFICLDGGPVFTFNSAVSFYCTFHERAAVESAWNKLLDQGSALMELQTYPWSPLYGWLRDKYGVNWQLTLDEAHVVAQPITPLLMFANEQAGKASAAMRFYTSLFDRAAVEVIVPYAEGEGEPDGSIKHGRFHLGDQLFMAMDSSQPQLKSFNEAISFQVGCKDQAEIDRLWGALTADGGQESQCGWCKDMFGVSWQIIPEHLSTLMEAGPDAVQALMRMRKIDIATLERAGQLAR